MRYHGGKFRLADWLLGFFPSHQCYVESFGGAASLLIRKPRSYAEVYNDLDSDIVNFFRVLQNPDSCRRLIELVTVTPYARDEFDLAWIPADDPIEQARRTVVRAQMGFGSAGATKQTTGFRVDTKREYGTVQQMWAQYPQILADVAQRFVGVLIENMEATKLMRMHDAPTTLQFVDPPYLHHTRVIKVGRSRGYRHEMSDDDHVELLECVKSLAGMVIICGYPSKLYESYLGGWTRYQITARAAGQRGGTTRQEVAWINPACRDALSHLPTQPNFFD